MSPPISCSARASNLDLRTAPLLLTVFAAAAVMMLSPVPALAEGVVITWVSEKQKPFAEVESFVADDATLAKQMEQLRKTVGEEAAKQLEKTTLMARQSAAHIDRDLTQYTFGIANESLVKRVGGVDVRIGFYDSQGRVTGALTRHFDVQLKPKEDTTLRFECEDDLCRDSASATVEITGADLVDVEVGAEDEMVFEWNGRRWFLTDRWQTEAQLELRTFSHQAYIDKPFDGRVFSPGKLKPDGRYYRVREDVPARYPEDSTGYEFEDGEAAMVYAYGLLPGFVVKDGQRAKPALLDTELSNIVVDGTIAAGELVQIRAVAAYKKSIIAVVSPVCQVRSGHRGLRAKLRFAFDKATMKGPDLRAIEPVVADWLEPVSIGEVADRCGPSSGTLVKRWTRASTPAEIEQQLGAPDARAETADGEVLVYGALKLRFVAGHLAGFERRSS